MKKKRHAFDNWSWRVMISGVWIIVMLAIFSLLVAHRAFRPSSSSTSSSSTVSSKSKIAFLFLARNRLPLDIVWDNFFEGSKGGDFTIYIHARPGFVYNAETTRCRYFFNRQLNNSILVEWGEASMIAAERLLLRTALEDPHNERFVLISESCIPLYSFEYTYTYLMSSTRSFVDSFADYKENRYNPHMGPSIPRDRWRKGSQWFAMTRKHATVILADDFIYPIFQEHCKRGALPEFWREYAVHRYRPSGKNCVPDEHYVQTVLAIKGYENEIERRTLTYTLWKYSGRRRERQSWHPVTFNFADVSIKTIQDIKAIYNINYETEGRTEWCSSNGHPQPCYLFARKFTRGAGVRLLNQVTFTAADCTYFHRKKFWISVYFYKS
ncbi:hypothetical protein O6H91_07G133000 [Diphasiastrum complanatum]|uniref:Uncharacterized protein n=1 Tax=Diphasiastrum complanatum TaxID=34168 RepID=A0ACC2D9V3_DIPCM|nr:hypothetical protein O6H91_07G133000 [Diphasiastrum complanatum]